MTRRGLTILETLLAAALLAMIAGALAAVIHQPAAWTDRGASDDLALFADTFLTQSETIEGVTQEWSAAELDGDGPSISVEVRRLDEASDSYELLEFRSEDRVVYRFVPILDSEGDPE